MRLLFTCTLICTLAIPSLAQTTPPLQPRQLNRAKSSVHVTDWQNRLTSKDPKVRTTAEAALVQGATRSLPLLRGFLNRRNEDLHLKTFKIIQRIGPPAIPLLVELLRDRRTSIRLGALNE
jgi:hypothetical protein